jgi:hydroxymethylbilane synthase
LKYVVGARGSQLSLAQTNGIISELKKINTDLEFEIKTILTKGDTDTRPLFTIDQKGIFEKEIDRAVAEKKIDFAVHSLKDVPSKIDENLVLACIPKREKYTYFPPRNQLDSLNWKNRSLTLSSVSRPVRCSFP